MANQDSFIDEVNEEVRRDRLFAMFRRYGWIAVLAVLVIVGVASWNEWRKASAQAEAEARGDALVAALSTGSPDETLALLSEIAVEHDPDLAALMGLFRAGADLEAGKADQAADDLAQVASSPDASSVYRDLARLKTVIASGSELSPDERIGMLHGMAQPGAPFRLLAEEQIALAEIERGNIEAAVAQLRRISEDSDASQGLRRRAVQLIVALGDTATN